MHPLSKQFSRFLLAAPMVMALHAGATAETVARYGISMADIPLTTGQPDRGAGAYQFTGHTIYDPLVAWESNIDSRPGKLVAGLASEWKVDAKDTKKWAFKLRKGAVFHDGSEFKAEAVIWNLDRVLNNKSPQFDAKQSAQVRPRIPSIASYSKIDDYTVEFTTKAVDALFPYQLPWFLISRPAQWEKVGRGWNKALEVAHELGGKLPLTRLSGGAQGTATPAHSAGDVYNMTPPTQGAVSLAILGLLDRTGLAEVEADSADHVHLVVEATKRAFQLRDKFITDPAYMTVDPQSLLDADKLDAMAATIDLHVAAPWGKGRGPGDTIWMGVIDESGLAVSFIQSIYHAFGSGIVLPTTGINWQNRGASFSLDDDKLLALKPGKKPFHTLNPAAARLKDGRTMVYGTMGGDGQPQTQAAVFTRHVVFGQPL